MIGNRIDEIIEELGLKSDPAYQQLGQAIVEECLLLMLYNNIEDGDRALGAAAGIIGNRFGVKPGYGLTFQEGYDRLQRS